MLKSRRTGMVAGPPWPLGALAAAGLALALAACQGQARAPVDCDQMLNEGKYEQVIDHCDSPYHRASAYLGQAGFDTFSLVESTADPGDVVALLGLTASNIDSKRLLINKAVQEVRKPKTGSQAFALLTAAFLGFAVTAEQFLDNGAGAGEPLDYEFHPDEVAAALLMSVGVATVAIANPPTEYFSTVFNGAGYTLNCTGDGSAPRCDTDPDTRVYDDDLGTGMLDTASPPGESSAKSSVLAAVATLAGAYPVHFTNLVLPISFDPSTQDGVRDFLGQGGVGGVFDIGMGAYLQYLQVADAALAEFGGTLPGQTAISEDIDALVSQLDNGGKRASDGGICASGDALALTLTLTNVSGLEYVYQSAAGTLRDPAPASPPTGYYTTRNLVSGTDVTGVTAFPALPAGTAFSTLNQYKVFYPLSTEGGFSVSNGTPRVDEADPDFIAQFENIPLILPAAPTANDGQLNVIELLCSAE